MFKRHVISFLIGFCQKQYLIVFIGLLMFIVGFQNVYPQQQIALDTYAIFQQSCLICHGPDGAYKESLLMEHNALIEKGSVVPGNPDASELYKRLITTETAKRMPLGQPQLSAQSINTIRTWILAGAPDWAVTSTTLNAGVGYTFSETPIHAGDTFTLNIRAENIADLAGWQFDIAFDPAVLEAVNVSEGDFLKTDDGTTFFQGGTIDNAAGKITGLSAARLSAEGVTGTGTLLQVRLKAKSGGETELALQNFQFGSVTGDSIPAGPHQIRIVVEGRLATGDVNRDGIVSILDLILVAQQLGKRVPAGSPVDVNGDGVVSILDLIRIAQGIGNTTASAAPPNPPAPLSGGEGRVDAATIEAWIVQAQLEDDGSLAFKQGIKNLENLLASLIPDETALLANYPNPFNPETWIPYQLAESAEVTLTIYDMNGEMIRRLAVGHQAAGMYQSRSRAAYWDGRNQLGEPVASGLYFYTLTAGEFTATRRMLILK